MKKIKVYLLLFLLLFLYCSICAISYVDAVGTSISNEVFRLHVIANSDDEDDQALKYIVRDKILEYVNSNHFNSKNETIDYLGTHSGEIKALAEQTIRENGYDYKVNVEIGNFDFPTKQYGDIAFPAGNYEALRVKIGDAEGQNWWCVMFPPLCFIDITSGVVDHNSKETLKSNLSNEEYALVSENNVAIQFKFKLFEFFNTFHSLLANK